MRACVCVLACMYHCIFFTLHVLMLQKSKSHKPPPTCSPPSEKENIPNVNTIKDCSSCRGEPAASIVRLVHQDHTYATMESPRTLKRKLDDAVIQLYDCRKKLKVEKQKSRRWKKKVMNLTSLVNTLRDLDLFSSSCADMLDTTVSGVPKQLMKQILNFKTSKNSVARCQRKSVTRTLRKILPKRAEDT